MNIKRQKKTSWPRSEDCVFLRTSKISKMKKTENCVALITGADGGIGTALTNELIKRKAAKIYAAGISTQRFNDLDAKHPNIIVPKVSRSPKQVFFEKS